MSKRTVHAKCAFLGFSLQKASMTLGVQVVITELEKLGQIGQRELDVTKEQIQILANGANLPPTPGGMDDGV